ncbi:hypothetical protein LZ683_08530 [Comamonas testosteroni]|uniref:hypothetical protein n=1 Tax=Comamonas testosteroni TaxID=285 RepID=UPI0023AA9F3E|nr:hypothetical protein [Comamonas testosteroni]WEE79386.1 hypothetical protein LZ683_08530 [Comamonas testosteroni]
METELDLIQRTNPGKWSEQQLEYLVCNAGHFTIREISAAIGKNQRLTSEKLKELGLDRLHRKLPEQLDDLQCIPEGMTVQACKSGLIYRVPSSTPGIVSRLVHVSSEESDDEDGEKT